jgi:hypothetical protein
MTTVINNGSVKVSNLLDDIALYKYNPSGIQRVVLEHLRALTDGVVDVIDPTNPFVFLLEASSVNTAAAMIENAANTRKQYPAAAQTPEDIYIHMSDVDFVDRFATPAMTRFSIMMQKDDVINKMISDPLTASKKVTIARNTEFTVAETTFSLQYPITIKQLSHGGLLITYDTDIVSPLQNLETNSIDYDVRTDSTGVDWLYFEFDVYQFKINSITVPISPSISFNQEIDLTDSYYYTRIYSQNKNDSNVWDEVYTTHTDQVYNNNTVTAVLKVTDKLLTVTIPQIYINSGLITGTLRIDVYETKGLISMTMDNYPITAFNTKIRSIDVYRDTTVYTAAMVNVNYIAYCTKTVNDGTLELSFDKLKERVIMNSVGRNNLPITNIQIESALETSGYQIVRNIDVITNRVFLATKPLPIPFDEKLITAGSASIETLIISIKDAINNSDVKNNGSRVTFTPDMIYLNQSGIIKIFPKEQLNALLTMSSDSIANNVSNTDYLYSPFHYVLDTSRDEFELRPYYLDAPEVQTIRFISQNETTQCQVNTQSYSIVRTTTGYKLSILTKSNDTFINILDKNISVQLSYIPINEVARAYINGVLSKKDDSGERVYDFDITCNFDIDTDDNIVFNSFKMFTTDLKLTSSTLVNTFDILYNTVDYDMSIYQTSAGDKYLGLFMLQDHTVNVTHETIRLKFGNSLKTLWARSRSVITAGDYVKYTDNIPWLYEKDVYKIDPITGSNFSFDANGDIVYTKLHTAGDPVLDADGAPVIKHYVGENILDAYGKPTAVNTNTITRQIDMMFIEGSYFFATDYAAIKYRNDMVNTILGWLTIDLTSMSQKLLEQTRLYFYPKKTMGMVDVIIDDGRVTTVRASQSFKIDLYVKSDVYKNIDLRNLLIKTTIKTIDKLLKQSTISISEITSTLRLNYNNDVVSFNLTGLGGSLNLETLTLVNESDRCSIRKRLIKTDDGKLIVQEDVDCTFINYQIT